MLNANIAEMRGTCSAAPGLTSLEEVYRSNELINRSHSNGGKADEMAFARLRDLIIGEARLATVNPRCSIKQDQIVWARSPVRLDIAGGWTDTPPYCLEQGGRVLNLAVDLNGQAPIQVLAKLSKRPEILLRSIDLGWEERFGSYDELDTFDRPAAPFSLAKAALALAGFLPRFHSSPRFGTLKSQLNEFGGGIELSLLSAVPKGSGLGASSILAATALAALSELCSLGWTKEVLFTRTLSVEQMLTTGGGWQDQAGALYRGVKIIETQPGLVQKPCLRWLPGDLFDHGSANELILLYYTGLTRIAKGILKDIVRRIFLKNSMDLQIIRAIRDNANFANDALQQCDYARLAEAVRTSWSLNQRLDSGTNPVGIQCILARIEGYLAGAKLLGAGGGGYLLLLARDKEAALRIKRKLIAHPPNHLARFVKFSLSTTGTQITLS